MKSMLTAAAIGMSLWTGVAAGQPVAEATIDGSTVLEPVLDVDFWSREKLTGDWGGAASGWRCRG